MKDSLSSQCSATCNVNRSTAWWLECTASAATSTDDK